MCGRDGVKINHSLIFPAFCFNFGLLVYSHRLREENPKPKRNKTKERMIVMAKFIDWCANVLKKTWEIKFKIRKNDEEKFSMPLLVLIVLMFAFWITIPLLIIGMFCGYKYRFEGMENVSVNLNDLSDRASLEIEALKRKYDAQ